MTWYTVYFWRPGCRRVEMDAVQARDAVDAREYAASKRSGWRVTDVALAVSPW